MSTTVSAKGKIPYYLVKLLCLRGNVRDYLLRAAVRYDQNSREIGNNQSNKVK